MIEKLFRKSSLTYDGIYRGKVVDNNDPDKKGRIKVRVYGIMQNSKIQTDSIPWAVSAQPLSNGAGTGVGSFYIPRVDSEVFLFFESGDFMSPVYFAEASNGIKGLPSFRTTNYPNRIGFKLENGIEFFIDQQSTALLFTHPGGVSVSVDSTGNMTVVSTKDVTIQAVNVIITGSSTVSINPS